MAAPSFVIVLAIALAQAPLYDEPGQQQRDALLGTFMQPPPWVAAWNPLVPPEAYADHLRRCTVEYDSGSPFTRGRVGGIRFEVPDGTYKTGDDIDIRITFTPTTSTALDLTHSTTIGGPDFRGPLSHTYLELNIPGRSAEFLNKTSGNILFYRYTVQDGDVSEDLGYPDRFALHTPALRSSGMIVACNLPVPEAAGSLRYESDVVVDGKRPTVESVTSPNASSAYAAGSYINVTVSFDEDIYVTGTPLLELVTGVAGGRNATYASGNGSSVLAFNYTVRPGDLNDDLNYTGVDALSRDGGTIVDLAGNNANLTLPSPGGSGSLSHSKDIETDTKRPAVESVTSPNASSAYAAGSYINVTVSFDEDIYVTGTPLLELVTGVAGGRNATYASGNGSSVLAFNYTVRPGDLNDDLNYTGVDALSRDGGTIVDLAGNNANLTLPSPGGSGSLSHSKDIETDTKRPTADSVSSATPNGTYAIGSPIDVRVTFSEDVDVDEAAGKPSIALATGAPGRYAEYDMAASTARTLAFSYTVTEGDDTADLDYNATAAVISLNGGIIRDTAGNNANLTLQPPGMDGLLGPSGTIVLDAIRPTADSVSSTTPNGTYPIGSPIDVRVTFSEDVDVDEAAGKPSIALATGAPGRYAEYDMAASTARTLAFSYTVTEGDDTPDLDYNATAAVISLNGGIIRDTAGNNANLTLQPPGMDGLLGPSGIIRLEAIRPYVESVFTMNDTGPYTLNSVIDVRVEFSENVAVYGASGSLPYVLLDTGGTDRRADLAAGSNNSDTLAFSYRVQANDATADLNYRGEDSLRLGAGGAIRDTAGNNAYLRLPATTDERSLGGLKDIELDTEPPTVLSAEAESLDSIRVTFDGPVVSGSTNASAGWSISGPGVGDLSIADREPIEQNAALTELVLRLDGELPDTGPKIELSYNGTVGGIRDEAGNPLGSRTGIGVADRIRPDVDEALITGPREVTIAYTEKVTASQGAYSNLEIGGVERPIVAHDPAAFLSRHVLSFTGVEAPIPEPTSNMTIDGRIVLDGADPKNQLGGGIMNVEILDGRVLAIHSSKITGPNTATITYTRSASAEQDAYSPLVVAGRPQVVTGLDVGGRGGNIHTLTFSPGRAPPNATGQVDINGTAVSSGSDMLLDAGTIPRALADGQSPSVRSATAVLPDTIRVLFTEPVLSPGTGAAGWSISGRDAAGLAVASSQDISEPSESLTLVLDGELPDTAPDAVLLYDQAAGNVEDPAGNGLVANATSVKDGIAPRVASAYIAGTNTAVIRYTEDVWAGPGAYESVALSGGDPRPVTDLVEGNGTELHTLAFGGAAAERGATGMLEMDVLAVRDAARNPLDADSPLPLVDSVPPSVRSATAVLPDTIRVLFTEPVLSPGTGAAGWSISGRDAAGLAVASSQDISEPSESLTLVLDGELPDTAPDAVLLYDQAAGNVEDPAGNGLVANATSVKDGIAPRVASAYIAGTNTAVIRYTEDVWAGPGAYASVALSSGGDPRPVTGLERNGTAAHTVSFGGDAAEQGTTGVLEMDAAAVLDAAMLPLDAELPLVLAAEAPQPRGNASARAAFTASNTVTITYSEALGPPEGHTGPVYSAVRIDGDGGGAASGGTRTVSGVVGLDYAVHTVTFSGDGVGRNQTGTITLAVDLEGAGTGGPPRLAAGEIPVASGRTVQAVLLTQPQAPPVSIEPDGFARTIDGTAAGRTARLAINITALAAASAAPGTAAFPAEAVTLAASFAEVTFPPGATARSVPAGGTFYLYADADAPLGESGTAALAYANSGTLVLRTVVEAGGGDGAGRIEFDRPVRISLDGQAGGRAFYIEGADGAPPVPIDLACAADDAERVHRQLDGSGECRIESDDGEDMVIHTYHLTRFGTVASERGTPPPVNHTCSVRLGSTGIAMEVHPGGNSDAAGQSVVNSGSQPFAQVGLDATPWYVDPASDAPGPNATSLPANRTSMSTAGSDAGFAPLPAAGGAAVAHGLGGGLELPLWFVLDLTGNSLGPGTELVQHITYVAECSAAE